MNDEQKTQKCTIRIPTQQYAYLEFEIEDTPENAIRFYIKTTDTYNQLKRFQQLEEEGHSQNEWAKIRERYLNKGEIAVEDFEKCSSIQRYFINEVKKSIRK